MRVMGLTDPGQVREKNEDVFAHDVERGLVVLADGMGGMNAGEVAARLAVDTLMDDLKETPEPCAAAFETAFAAANAMVYEKSVAQAEYLGMGTTLVAIWLDGASGFIGNVGDSRLYRLRAGRLTQLTTDHSVVQQMVDEGLLTAEEARHAPNRNIITRAIGVEPAVDVDVVSCESTAADLLLLCSDGLSDLVDDDSIRDEMVNARDDLRQAARGLIARANDAGGTDNITVVLLQL